MSKHFLTVFLENVEADVAFDISDVDHHFMHVLTMLTDFVLHDVAQCLVVRSRVLIECSFPPMTRYRNFAFPNCLNRVVAIKSAVCNKHIWRLLQKIEHDVLDIAPPQIHVRVTRQDIDQRVSVVIIRLRIAMVLGGIHMASRLPGSLIIAIGCDREALLNQLAVLSEPRVRIDSCLFDQVPGRQMIVSNCGRLLFSIVVPQLLPTTNCHTTQHTNNIRQLQNFVVIIERDDIKLEQSLLISTNIYLPQDRLCQSTANNHFIDLVRFRFFTSHNSFVSLLLFFVY